MSKVRTCPGDSTQFLTVKPRFLKNPQINFFLSRLAAWYPNISKFLRLRSMMSQPSDVFLRCLDQKLHRFKVQKQYC